MALTEIAFQYFRFSDTAAYLSATREGLVWPAGSVQKMGAWVTTVGELNRGVVLYQKETAAEPQTANRALLAALPGIEEKRHLLQPLRNFIPPDQSLKIQELRLYNLYPGKVEEFLSLLLAILPLRERYSPNAGIWHALEGDTTRVFHLWAYQSYEERDRSRMAINIEPGWRDYVGKITPLIAKMQSSFLQTVAY
jgi:NIPSNAP